VIDKEDDMKIKAPLLKKNGWQPLIGREELFAIFKQMIPG
jgi:hypothetical protein